MLVVYITIGIGILAVFSYYIFVLAPKLDPKNRAEEFIKTKRFNEAVVEYKKILDNKPFDSTILYRLSNVYLELDNIDEAALALEKILQINSYNYEVDKYDIQKKLGKIYYSRDEIEKTFQMFMDVINSYPADKDAMHHLAFIGLGQEEYDFAYRYFEKLASDTDPGFDILFGAGITAYQNQKINECVDHFKKALEKRPDSQIANLAMAFSLWRKRDYSKAQAYAGKLYSISDEMEVQYIALRLDAMLLLHLKKHDHAIKKFDEVLQFASEHDMSEEYLLALYDIGFACVRADRIKQAEGYWKRLSHTKRTYRNIQNLLMTLHREMEKTDDSMFDDTIFDYIDGWSAHFFPKDFLWKICGLKADITFDLKSQMVTTRVRGDLSGGASTVEPKRDNGGGVDNLDTFIKLDTEKFRMISNRLVQKLGYKVDQIMTTYKEPDGVDFMALHKTTGDKTFVSVRRWNGVTISDVPLRNFAQMVNEVKAKKGLFVTISPLTDGALKSLEQLNKVDVIFPEDVNSNLVGLI